MTKREGYPLNYEFTGESMPVDFQYDWRIMQGIIVGYEEEICRDQQGHPIPPPGFVLIQMPNGSIVSRHISQLR